MTFYYPTNITNFYQLFGYADYVTEGYFGLGLLVIIFVVLFIAMRSASNEYYTNNAKIFAACSFFTTVISVFFFIIGICDSTTMTICIVITAVSVLSNALSGRGY